MMTPQTLSIYQIDAFTDVLFSGNPAAVVPLSDWLPDDLMQKIAMENNLSETAFFVPCVEDDERRMGRVHGATELGGQHVIG